MLEISGSYNCSGEPPIIVVARSDLGALNHTLLSLEALQDRNLKIAGVFLSGPKNSANKKDIEKQGKVSVLLKISLLFKITTEKLLEMYKDLKKQVFYVGSKSKIFLSHHFSRHISACLIL